MLVLCVYVQAGNGQMLVFFGIFSSQLQFVQSASRNSPTYITWASTRRRRGTMSRKIITTTLELSPNMSRNWVWVLNPKLFIITIGSIENTWLIQILLFEIKAAQSSIHCPLFPNMAKGKVEKKKEKLTTTGNHGTMYQFFFGVFTHFSKFSRHAWEKFQKCQFLQGCMYV